MSKKNNKPTAYDTLVEQIRKEPYWKSGMIAETARQLSMIQNRHISRQHVDRWFSPDRSRRHEPCYSAALQLFEAIQLAREAMERKINE